jgi:hypothetical protein
VTSSGPHLHLPFGGAGEQRDVRLNLTVNGIARGSRPGEPQVGGSAAIDAE